MNRREERRARLHQASIARHWIAPMLCTLCGALRPPVRGVGGLRCRTCAHGHGLIPSEAPHALASPDYERQMRQGLVEASAIAEAGAASDAAQRRAQRTTFWIVAGIVAGIAVACAVGLGAVRTATPPPRPIAVVPATAPPPPVASDRFRRFLESADPAHRFVASTDFNGAQATLAVGTEWREMSCDRRRALVSSFGYAWSNCHGSELIFTDHGGSIVGLWQAPSAVSVKDCL